MTPLSYGAIWAHGGRVHVLGGAEVTGAWSCVEADDVDDALARVADAGRRALLAEEAYEPHAAVVGVVGPLSVQSGMRAAWLAGFHIGACVSYDDRRTEDERVAALVDARPDLILLVGGSDYGDVRHVASLADLVAQACTALEARNRQVPRLLFAGNPVAAPNARDRLGEGLLQASNVRPCMEREDLEHTVRMLAALGAGGAHAIRAVPAAAARSLAVLELSRTRGRLALLHEGEGCVELISHLDGHWNRVTGSTVAKALARHRAWARELAGVALHREIADAFAPYVAWRDLLDVVPPSQLWVATSRVTERTPEALAEDLLEAFRPRGVGALAQVDPAFLTLAGLSLLAGEEAPVRALRARSLGTFASLDGPAASVSVHGPGFVREVAAGRRERLEVRPRERLRLQPAAPGDLGAGRGGSIDLEVEDGVLWIDTLGTPVPPERTVRELSRRDLPAGGEQLRA